MAFTDRFQQTESGKLNRQDQVNASLRNLMQAARERQQYEEEKELRQREIDRNHAVQNLALAKEQISTVDYANQAEKDPSVVERDMKTINQFESTIGVPLTAAWTNPKPRHFSEEWRKVVLDAQNNIDPNVHIPGLISTYGTDFLNKMLDEEEEQESMLAQAGAVATGQPSPGGDQKPAGTQPQAQSAGQTAQPAAPITAAPKKNLEERLYARAASKYVPPPTREQKQAAVERKIESLRTMASDPKGDPAMLKGLMDDIVTSSMDLDAGYTPGMLQGMVRSAQMSYKTNQFNNLFKIVEEEQTDPSYNPKTNWERRKQLADLANETGIMGGDKVWTPGDFTTLGSAKRAAISRELGYKEREFTLEEGRTNASIAAQKIQNGLALAQEGRLSAQAVADVAKQAVAVHQFLGFTKRTLAKGTIEDVVIDPKTGKAVLKDGKEQKTVRPLTAEEKAAYEQDVRAYDGILKQYNSVITGLGGKALSLDSNGLTTTLDPAMQSQVAARLRKHRKNGKFPSREDFINNAPKDLPKDDLGAIYDYVKQKG